MKIAIIGGGAAGITAAHLLNKTHHVTVYEKQPILGGNIRTINKNVAPSALEPTVNLDPSITIDNGVIEFQTDHFVYFHKLMQTLNVPTAPVNGGSSALYLANKKYIAGPGVIRGSGLSTGARLRAYGRLSTIMPSYLRFRHQTSNPQIAIDNPISQFWPRNKWGDNETWHKWQKMLLMYGYSIAYDQLDDFPAEIAFEILRNSGYGTRWTRIVGGVYTYIEKILESFNGEICLNAQIRSITRGVEKEGEGVEIKLASGESAQFDKIVFAMPPDQVLKLLADPTEAEVRRFAEWQSNQATTIIHTDTSLYKQYGTRYYSEFDLFEKKDHETGKADAGYNAYLNRLCGLPETIPHYNLAYNLTERIDPQQIIHTQHHHTPLYTTTALRHRQEIIATNGENHTYHAGAYLRNGLHEGAIESADAVSRLLGGALLG